jgi:hypothetical protein
VFEERLFQPSATPQACDNATPDEEPPPPPPTLGAPNCGLASGNSLLLAAAPQVASWITELKDYLTTKTLPEDDTEAERVARQAKLYYIKEGKLYRVRPNRVAL